MIVELTVENLAIIERAHLRLGPGFTVLTGETGAGKSLVVDAIELALGERADAELVRSGSSRASVSLVVDLSDNPELLSKCADLGLALEDSTLYVQREVFAEGRSQCRVGGKMVPVSGLRQLGELLVDLHGQHDHQSLLDANRHIGYLDSWIGQPAAERLVSVSDAFARYDHARKRLEAFRSDRRDVERRVDLLRFEIEEIESIAPIDGEMADLEAHLSRLNNADKLANAAFGALNALSEEEPSIVDRLASALKPLEGALLLDPQLASAVEPLQSAAVYLDDARMALRDYSDSLDSDPASLERVAERIDSLRRLRRKYGEDERAVLAYLEKICEELDLLTNGDQNEESMAEQVRILTEELAALCADLSQLRRESASRFTEIVASELTELAMPKSQFVADFRTAEPGPAGADAMEFYFSANAGERPRPLAKIASGGEISRVMLAVKTALAGRAGVPTLIFDEIDAGLGGREAAVVANKLSALATHGQVVAISHLPQIAAKATTHHKIEKQLVEGRVVTVVRRLADDERVTEIARMLAGERITDTSMANAREMLGRPIAGDAADASLF